jgi:hypothetical protein
VPGRKVTDVQSVPGEALDLSHLALREETIGDPALIEDLDRARLQTACARSQELVVDAPLDHRDVDTRQRQLARKHESRRTSSRDHNRVLTHGSQPSRAGCSVMSQPALLSRLVVVK